METVNPIPADAVAEAVISRDKIITKKASISIFGIEAFFINKNLKKRVNFVILYSAQLFRTL